MSQVKSADYLGTLEPVFTFEYEAIFNKLDSKALKLIRKVNLPESKVSVINVNYKNRIKTIAGKPEHKSLSLDIEAFVEPKTAILAWKWYRLVYPKPGVFGKPSSYKDPMSQILLTNGRNEPIATWKLLGVWPSDIKMTDASDNTNEIIKISMTIEYDDVSGPE
jgi:hypothetical protein